MLNMKYYQYYYKKFENIWKIAVIIHRKSCLIPNIFFQRYNKLYSLPENAIFQAKSWKKIYTTVLQINHETFQDFIDEQKFSLINISLKENFFLEKVRVIFFFFFLEIYCNKDEAIFQWWPTMEKTVTEREFIPSLGKRMLR